MSAVPVCDVAEGVDIPFGTTELGAPAVLHLGTTPVHGIVTGTTGTGKTVFFKNAIESICTHYSPNDVELWLVDYKRSDFALYKQPEHHFPHIGFLGFDTSSDFIRAFSRKLVKEMEDRQEKTVETKTTGINSYNR